MTASLYGGALSLTGSASIADEKLSLSVEGALTGFDLSKAANKIGGALDVTGKGDVQFKGTATGYSQFQLAAQTLNGEGGH